MNTISLKGKRIGAGHPCFIIAEIAQSHDGSLGMAHSFIDAVAATGVDAIKFQTHIAAAESTLDEPFRVKFSHQDQTRFDYWKRMEFTPEQWQGLHDHAFERGLVFLSSPFSIEAVELLDKLDVPAWKIASGEVGYERMLDAMLATGKPLLCSTGMSGWKDIDAVVEKISASRGGYGLFQCTSSYPVPVEKVGLNVLGEFRQRYNCPVGLSDHSGILPPALAAIARGADMIEVHAAFDRSMFGPDVPVSLRMNELSLLAQMRDACVAMDRNPVDKDAVAAELARTREIFTRSWAAKCPLAAGTVLTADMLVLKKPGSGIRAQELPKLINKSLLRDVSPDRLLQWDDIANSEKSHA